jgi:hypothetical protein
MSRKEGWSAICIFAWVVYPLCVMQMTECTSHFALHCWAQPKTHEATCHTSEHVMYSALGMDSWRNEE